MTQDDSVVIPKIIDGMVTKEKMSNTKNCIHVWDFAYNFTAFVCTTCGHILTGSEMINHMTMLESDLANERTNRAELKEINKELQNQLTSIATRLHHSEAVVRWDNKIFATLKELKDLADESKKEKKGMTDGKLSPEQIENWRKVLFGMIGPYAKIMPADEIQKFRDKMQRDADADSIRLESDKGNNE